MAWLGPADSWPAHERKEAQRALEEARSQDWSLNPASGHIFGTLRCPTHTDPACEVKVLCTGKGDASGALTAKIIREKLRHCRSRPGAGPAPLVEDPNALLNNAERLVEAASRLRRSEQLLSLSGSHLERAVDAGSVDAEKSLMEEAEAAEERAWVESYAARAEAFRFGLGEPWPPADGAAELDKAAREQLELARRGSSAVSDSAEFEARIRSIETRLGPNA